MNSILLFGIIVCVYVCVCVFVLLLAKSNFTENLPGNVLFYFYNLNI